MVIPTMHRAAVIPEAKADLVIQDRPTPSVGPDQVLIKAYAIALNPIDWKRQAWDYNIKSYPVVLGSDVAGVVVKVGNLVKYLKIDDRVIGIGVSFVSGNNDEGAFQEYLLSDSIFVMPIPDSLSFEESAGLGQSTATASMVLYDHFGLERPTTVSLPELTATSPILLVWGGASSVGSMIVQMGRNFGFEVYATASKKNHDLVRGLGASFVVDYHDDTAEAELIAAAEKTGRVIKHAIEAIGTLEVAQRTTNFLSTSGGGKFGHVFPFIEQVTVPDSVKALTIKGDELLNRRRDLAEWLFKDYLLKSVETGTIKPSLPPLVVDGGLEGLQTAMGILMSGVSASKPVVKLAWD